MQSDRPGTPANVSPVRRLQYVHWNGLCEALHQTPPSFTMNVNFGSAGILGLMLFCWSLPPSQHTTRISTYVSPAGCTRDSHNSRSSLGARSGWDPIRRGLMKYLWNSVLDWMQAAGIFLYLARTSSQEQAWLYWAGVRTGKGGGLVILLCIKPLILTKHITDGLINKNLIIMCEAKLNCLSLTWIMYHISLLPQCKPIITILPKSITIKQLNTGGRNWCCTLS